MSDQSALLVALEAFEVCLEVPIIPGEFPNWTAGTKKACSRAVAALEEHIPNCHVRVLAQISREDPELATRVQKLRDEDAALLSQAREVEAEANMMAGDATELESQDPTIQEDVEGFIARGLAWIIQVRKQEAALTAWYQEAFNRDTGVAD